MSHNLQHMGYAIFRTPNLSVDDWLKYIEASKSLQYSAEKNIWESRACIAKKFLERSDVSEAIYLGSPGFYARLNDWNWEINSKDDIKLLMAFERYLNRMCFRSTPFGMFSAVGYAEISSNGDIESIENEINFRDIKRVVRIDGDALHLLSEKASTSKCAELKYAVNSSIYRFGEKYRFTDWRLDHKNERVYELSEIDAHPLISKIIENGSVFPCNINDIVKSVSEFGVEIDPETKDLVEDLAAAKVLVPHISLDPLNENPTKSLANLLIENNVNIRLGHQLLNIEKKLKSIEKNPFNAITQYSKIDEEIREISGSDIKQTSIQVDAFYPSDRASIDKDNLDNVLENFNLIFEKFSSRQNTLDEFCKSFINRFGNGFIPLAEVLDPDNGIVDTFPRQDMLLRKLGVKHKNVENSKPIVSSFDSLLLKKIKTNPELLKSKEIYITKKDISDFPRSAGKFSDEMQLLMKFPCVIRNGKPERVNVLIGSNTIGAVNWISRFCHGDKRMYESSIRFANKIQERAETHVIHAEISYLPSGRMANVLTRPPIWKYRINLMSPAASPSENDISLSDLLVRVRGKEIYLWSKRLKKRVIPHLTSAHNANHKRNIEAYKFLCNLQTHGLNKLKIGWGDIFKDLVLKPRIWFENIILVPARWTFNEKLLRPILKLNIDDQIPAFRSLLLEYGVPAQIELQERDNTLVLNWNDFSEIEQIMRIMRKGKDLVFSELIEDYFDSSLSKRNFVRRHEVVIPLLREHQQKQTSKALEEEHADFSRDLIKVPFSQVVYAKIYGGHENLDVEFLPIMKNFLEKTLSPDEMEQWFFIRYSDPSWHLRLRIFPKTDHHLNAIRKLTVFLELAQLRGIITHFDFSQYEREIVRYGGMARMVLHEKLFCIDSSMVLNLLDSGNNFSHVPRWKIAMIAIDSLLEDFDIQIEQKLDLMLSLASNFNREYSIDKKQSIAFGREYRRNSKELLSAFRKIDDSPDWSKNLYKILNNLSLGRKEIAAEIVTRINSDFRSKTREISGQIHMLCNRLFAANARDYEVVVYDYMVRTYQSLIALSRAN